MLTEQQIKEEAERLYPETEDIANDAWASHINDIKRSVHIAAATKYQKRAKPVLEALQEMLRQFKPEFQHWNQQAAVEHAEKALTNYNESLKG